MKTKSFYLITVLLLSITINLNAQTDSLKIDSSVNKISISKMKSKPLSNFIKINVLGILLKNYQIQYERALTRKISIAVAFRAMPISTIPLKDQVIKYASIDDPDTKETLDKFRVGNFAVTPEIRFYLSKKGFGRGIYIAPFYMYSSFTTNDMVFHYTNGSGGTSGINLSGKLTSNTGGILIGVQKTIGKHVCIDYWLLGPHYGSGKGNFAGIPDKPLTQQEQDDLSKQLNNINIPLIHETVMVTSNSASLKLDGPWAGMRTGISIGVRF